MEKVINILLIEDDTLDVRDVQRTLTKMGVLYKMEVCKNGEEGLQYLQKLDNEKLPRPEIVLLDLNMPKMNGQEFLQMIRKDSRWKDMKIFIITTSDEIEDREKSKALGISGYIVKPLKFNNTASLDSFNLMIDLMNI